MSTMTLDYESAIISCLYYNYEFLPIISQFCNTLLRKKMANDLIGDLE